MAELNTGDSGGGKGKVRSKKSNAKVDLTAMVDLAFLLITFFMLTTSLSKPQSMDLPMPDKTKTEFIKIADARTLTVLIGPNNRLKYYMGQFASPIEEPTDIGYGKNGIRKKILEKKASVPITMGAADKGVIVLIKADKKANYKNLVDILDEIAICKVPTYAIVDITKEEAKLFEK
ncbi:MAG: biopolymer transporter ExbD [Flavobacterium sp. BFFFF1]|uniref:ExbD/TolR family protein n=1 Tax=Flavobacterium sp. BFFFF1 TaxID=2015557 RepID=UPI000BC437DB|nr:biopolymer transporter ExbD [Flavobacterium sp. BFFFF1]OYU79783.1 MAG: biopolymer transporter ExbD [Flavobacterium sp. BFFFF1]